MAAKDTRRQAFARGLGVFLLFAAIHAAPAYAAPPDFLLSLPGTQIAPGSGAAELRHPRGMAADPVTGRVFIAESQNARISEYTAWGFFVRAWGWGVEDGSAAPQTCGPPEAEEDPDPPLCQVGALGAGKGQMDQPFGIAVDAAGNVYVFEVGNLRVQKFSPSGQFLLMFGGDVNRTKVDEGAPAAQRNRCPVDPGDVCQAGISGDEPSQLSGTIGDYIAYSPVEGGRIVVGDKGGIQFFDVNGNWVKTVAFTGPLAAFIGEAVNGLDVDSDGNIYFSLSSLEDVFKLDASGAPAAPGKPSESKFGVGNPLGVAVDAAGNVYSVDIKVLSVLGRYVLGYSSSGEPVEGMEASDEFGAGGDDLTGIATNECAGSSGPTLYLARFGQGSVPRSYVDAYGALPIGCEAPPLRPPEIVSQFATSIGRGEATVKAGVNPLFWNDTTYYVEYGIGECSAGGCPVKAPLSPTRLTQDIINAPVTTAGVVLDDLEPNTTYHYRFVAQSTGGGPVFGVDPDGRAGPAKADEAEGLEATFKTARPAGKDLSCPNDAVRTGESTKLPDCRAYELVSPLDKGGGDVALWRGRNASFPEFFELHQSAPSAGRFTYTSAFAFAEPGSAPYVSQYIAERSAGDWVSTPLSPPRTESPVIATTLFGNDFHGFSRDLCQGWLLHFSVSTLAPGAIEKYPNLYRRDDCTKAPSYEALTIEHPPARKAADFWLVRTQGFSEDGSYTIFTANDKLHPDAPSLPGDQDLLLYEHTGGNLRFVCYFPNGDPIDRTCSAGTAAGGQGASTSPLHNAISDNGSRIFWSAYTGSPKFGNDAGAPGQIYVRIDGTETKKVSTTVADDAAWYWTASDDGSKAIFELDSGPHKDELYELDVDTETPTLIADEVEGPMGASEDASRIYFASKEDLDDTGPATAGDHNLYLYEADPGGGGGEFTFIMELTATDLEGSADERAPIDELPWQRAARVTSDGLRAAFVSSISPTPTGFDNLDSNTGEPTQQVYLYDAVSDELRCVSCNGTGARPVGEDLGVSDPFYAAAGIQGWELNLHAPRVLSEDGTRVFFESFEALVPRDTNGTWDVYQWEEEGKGTCKATSETFNEESGGCVDLISSGLSAAKSTFLDADPSGNNIFFSTQSSLVGPDYGLNDVYVARVGGGFPEPTLKTECEGEACQSPPPPPPEVTPSTETSAGPGNEPATRPRPRPCPKGKRAVRRAGKVRCVKRKAKARANKSRRAGR